MKISHIILAGTALALSGCWEQKEKTPFDEAKEKNAKIIAELVKRYPQGQTFYRPGGMGNLILKTHPTSVIATFTTSENVRTILEDSNGDGSLDDGVLEDPRSNRKHILKDINSNGFISYERDEELSTGTVIMEVTGMDWKWHIDKIVIPSMWKKNLRDNPEIEKEIALQLWEHTQRNNNLYHTLLSKTK